jgi:hypothetical protein
MISIRIAAVSFAVALLSGCPEGSGAPDATPCDVDIEWGYVTDTGDFIAYSDDDDAEIVLGFQGFRYINSVVEIIDTTATQATAQFQIDVDGHATYGQPGGPLTTTTSPRGVYVNDLLVFFNDIPMPELVGRTCTIIARATADGCVGTYSARVTLVDDENCTEGPDGGLTCE